MAKSSGISKTAVWILLGLLIIGLAGFGATNMSGNIRTIGKVGELPISTQSYFMSMQRELRSVQERTGEVLPFAQARAAGLDRAVLNRLITLRALDNEAAALGLSVGDENVRDQVLAFDAFQALDGSFDREAYAFALDRQGMTESEFEQSLREETARTLLQSAVVNGVTMPDSFANALVSYAGEQRSFTWAALDAGILDAPVPTPTDDELRSFYDENTEQFMLPVTKRIAYAHLTPDMLVDEIDLDDEALQQAYRDRLSEFSQPERRLVERLVFLDEDSAASAAASLEVDGTTFETLVESRGLSLQDVDLGDVGRLELDAAGEAVFAAEVGAVVGPLPSDLGPALFRVNAILPAQSTSFEDAVPQLRDTLALDRARRIIEQQAESYEDLLAGGATLEELASETDMELGTVEWSVETAEGIAAYEDFRAAAAELTADDFAEIKLLEDGGVFAMRLEEELPERPEPFDSARAAVTAALIANVTEVALAETAQALKSEIESGADFAALGLTETIETDRTRGAFVPGTPPNFLTEVFQMDAAEVRIIQGGGVVSLVRLDAVSPVANSPEADALRQNLQGSLDQALAQDLFNVFTIDVATRTPQQIDPRAVEAVNANFP